MAIMHPSDIMYKKHFPSEEKFYNACRDQLSDKYHVFFSVRWYSEENGKRIDSECDFLIFNPDYGFLCIECKGGHGIYVDNNGIWYLKERDGDRKLRCSPYKQAEESMRFFKKYYETELETAYPGVYGCAVAFPWYTVTTPPTIEAPMMLTIDQIGMQELPKRIVEIFHYFKVKKGESISFLAPDSQKKFINLINKRIALSIAAGALIEDKKQELIKINQIQDVVIDMLIHYSRAFIIGGAGTGKTWIGIKKIRRCLADGGKALYLCCNPMLAKKVKEHINNLAADVYTIDKFAELILGKDYIGIPMRNGCKEYSDLFEKLNSLPQYDLIIVDEAQDFTEDWAYCANLLTKSNGSLYVFYDENQNIFSRSFGEKFFITSEPFVLRYNIRNTSNIYQYTLDKTTLGLDTLANQIEGVKPDERTFTQKQAVISFVDSIVNKLVNKEGISPEKITILSNLKTDLSVLRDVKYIGGYPLVDIDKYDSDSIAISTVEDFKGLESDIVIYINQTYKNEAKIQYMRSMHYTAYTRARFYLYVVNYEINI